MDPLTSASIAIVCVILALITYERRLLTADGSVAAGGVGIIIGLIHPSWLVLLFFFLIAGVLVTKYRFSYKERRGTQEGKKGERGYRNVLSTGLVPLFVALLSIGGMGIIPPGTSGILFLTAVATAASDTLASEMGVLSERTRLITTWKRVRPGTNGGISLYGTLWALAGAMVTSAAGALFLGYFSDTITMGMTAILLPGIMGFAGCMVDSVLGATLENRGTIGKGSVNFLSALIVTALVWPLL